MLKDYKHNRKFKIAAGIVILVAILLIGYLIYQDQQEQKSYQIVDSDAGTADQIYTIRYNGEEYDYNSSIEAVLLIGVDSRGEMKSQENFGVDACADNIDLIIMDRENQQVKILPISRDTITDVTKFSVNGYKSGSYTTHIAFAFSYGDGGRASCENMCDAVSDLLYGVTVRYYLCTNLDSIAFANDLLGGVKVTCPNDDLADKYQEMTEGAAVTLNDSNAEDFLRYRDTNKDYSNNGRMQRQQAFLEGFVENVKAKSSDEFADMWKKLTSDDSNILTNMNKAQFVKITDKVDEYKYNPAEGNLKIDGTDKVEDEHDAFYPDENSLKRLVVDTFYVKR